MFNKYKYDGKKAKRKNNNKKFLNNKKSRKEKFYENSEYTLFRNGTYSENNKIPRKDIYEIPGYYYDNEKNRYFPLNFKEQKKNPKKEEIQLKNSKKDNIGFSNFNLIHYCKIKEKRILKNYYDKIKALKKSDLINIEYEGDKLPNSLYTFYLSKYLLILDYFNPNTDNYILNNFISIIIHDVINNKFIKKIIIEDFYNDFIIKENNLILIDNITKISIIKDIKELIESKDENILFKFIKKFNINIDNIERISMVYKWPFINIINNFQYYYLVWNNFYFFDIGEINNKITLKNSDALYLSKNQIFGYKNDFLIRKVYINKKNHYINFFITFDSNGNNKIPYFYLFSVTGEIHCYFFNKNNKFKLKSVITNKIMNNIQIINLIPFKNDYNYLIISNKNDILNLNLKHQTMTKIDFNENNENKSIKYKTKIFIFNEDFNSIIFDDNNYIKVLSLDDFTIIKKFLYDNYKYNILTINKSDLIVI